MQKWVVRQSDGRTFGPISSSKLRKFAASGAITTETRIQLVGSGRWIVAGKVQGLFCRKTARDESPPSSVGTDKELHQSTPSGSAEPLRGSPTTRNVLFVALSGLACSSFFILGLFVSASKDEESAPKSREDSVVEILPVTVSADSLEDTIPNEELASQSVSVEVAEDTSQNLLTVESIGAAETEFQKDLDSSATPLSGQDLAKLLSDSTATITVRLADGESIGSGFFVEDDRTLITCLHVVKGAEAIFVELPNGKRTECLVYRTFSEPWDIVILRTSQSLSASSLQLASSTPAQGELVYAYGAPKGFSGTISSGIVGAIRSQNNSIGSGASLDDTNIKLVQFTAPISPGSSGGPIVNERGHVVGIARSKWSTADAVNFAIDVTHLQQLLLDSHRGSESLLTSLPARPPEQPKQGEMDPVAKALISQLEKHRAEIEKTRKSNEKIAAAQMIEDARIERERENARIEREQEYARDERVRQLQARITKGKQLILRVEAEGTALDKHFRKVEADARTVESSYTQLSGQASRTRGQIRGVENELLLRQQAAQQGQEYRGDPRTNAQLARDLQRLRNTLVQMEAEGRRLEAHYQGLDQQARSLRQQYAAKDRECRGHRTLLAALLNELEKENQLAPNR